MQKKILVAAVATVLSLSACGDTALEQGLFGAGAGAATAAVLGGNTTTGAVLGGAANILFCQENPTQC